MNKIKELKMIIRTITKLLRLMLKLHRSNVPEERRNEEQKKAFKMVIKACFLAANLSGVEDFELPLKNRINRRTVCFEELPDSYFVYISIKGYIDYSDSIKSGCSPVFVDKIPIFYIPKNTIDTVYSWFIKNNYDTVYTPAKKSKLNDIPVKPEPPKTRLIRDGKEI